MDATRKQLWRTLFQLRGSRYSKCFAPGVECDGEAIRAHSIQNAKALDLICEDGHVSAPIMRMTRDAPPTVEFGRVGRNKASTFAGLCSDHDSAIFSPIELEEVDWASSEHLFLVAYRAVLFELHASCAAAAVVQGAYLKRVDLGIDPEDEASEAGIIATHRLLVAYQMYLYKLAWDDLYLSRTFNGVEHDVLTFQVRQATVAASTLFSLDAHFVDDAFVWDSTSSPSRRPPRSRYCHIFEGMRPSLGLSSLTS